MEEKTNTKKNLKNDDHCLRVFDIAKQLLTRHSTFTHFIHKNFRLFHFSKGLWRLDVKQMIISGF